MENSLGITTCNTQDDTCGYQTTKTLNDQCDMSISVISQKKSALLRMCYYHNIAYMSTAVFPRKCRQNNGECQLIQGVLKLTTH